VNFESIQLSETSMIQPGNPYLTSERKEAILKSTATKVEASMARINEC